MARRFQIIVCLIGLCLPIAANDTFSIVAVDPLTGEVGGAGASCLDETQFPGSGGVLIISDVLPGIGCIHTQSYYLPANQQNARARMLSGDSPDEMMTWLSFNDAENNSSVRQYGAARLNSTGDAAAAFTGSNCLDYKNHIVGPNYAIQGNILLGQEILDSMEARFLRVEGELADKLMAALQGANVPGADTRCAGEGVSSLSAFVRVAKPLDNPDSLYLDLSVPSTPFGMEPIDSLQSLFDVWKADTTTIDTTTPPDTGIGTSIRLQPNSDFSVRYDARNRMLFVNAKQPIEDSMHFELVDIQGLIVIESHIRQEEMYIELPKVSPSRYFYRIMRSNRQLGSGSLFIQ